MASNVTLGWFSTVRGPRLRSEVSFKPFEVSDFRSRFLFKKKCESCFIVKMESNLQVMIGHKLTSRALACTKHFVTDEKIRKAITVLGDLAQSVRPKACKRQNK